MIYGCLFEKYIKLQKSGTEKYELYEHNFIEQ